jgi:putative radical SAM enzyme (TIGR03279 family)
MIIADVEGEPLRDIIDWLWLTSDAAVHLTVLSASYESNCERILNHPGDASTHSDVLACGDVRYYERGCVHDQEREHASTSLDTHSHGYTLTRDYGEDWGITFADPLFDGLITCRNACAFCFMTMLPKDMRPSLYERDDDYRLSFLQGNFVTLTNLDDQEVRRIIDQRLSPLHVSLHAITPETRKRLMGRNHARGIEALEQLLRGGIEAHAQLVLVPGINDEDELDATLAWTERQPNILSVGIVPYGFTDYARIQDSFDTERARRVIARVAPWQKRSRAQSGSTRFQLADEWYLLANAPLPPAEYYDGYPQFEDGIGMLRTFEDEWEMATQDRKGTVHLCLASKTQMNRPLSACTVTPTLILVTGEAFAPTLRRLTSRSFPDRAIEVQAVRNRFFGGNVNVAGLLTAQDIITQLRDRGIPEGGTVALPRVLFNADGLTLDDKRDVDIAEALKRQVLVVPCTAEGIIRIISTWR